MILWSSKYFVTTNVLCQMYTGHKASIDRHNKEVDTNWGIQQMIK